MKVKCLRDGCNYYATAEAAEDAIADLQDHLREVHGSRRHRTGEGER
jgi:predicted small metal-binding protein